MLWVLSDSVTRRAAHCGGYRKGHNDGKEFSSVRVHSDSTKGKRDIASTVNGMEYGSKDLVLWVL